MKDFLNRMFKGWLSPEKRWPESQEHDYTKQFWGHALHGMDRFRRKGKFEITGHNANKGVLFAKQLTEGDTLRISFTNGDEGVLRVSRIKWFGDPSDMFSATVEFEGVVQ